MIGSRNDHDEIAKVLSFIHQSSESAVRFRLLAALGEGLKTGATPLDFSAVEFRDIFAAATQAAPDGQLSEGTRMAALQLLGLSTFEKSGGLLLQLLDQAQSQTIQIGVISALSRFNDSSVGQELTKRWDNLSPRLRSQVLSALLARPDRCTALLQAIE